VLSGRETLEFVSQVRGLGRQAVEQLLPTAEHLAFTSELDNYVGGYSHGTKKKLAILAALVHQPRVLLLDEPTNGLDPPTAARVKSLLGSLAVAGVCVVLSTHMLDMADRMCDRVLVLHRGRLILDGTVESLRETAGVSSESTLEDAFLRLVDGSES
jgi:ABC-2 type transport system ATP-binding protein